MFESGLEFPFGRKNERESSGFFWVPRPILSLEIET